MSIQIIHKYFSIRYLKFMGKMYFANNYKHFKMWKISLKYLYTIFKSLQVMLINYKKSLLSKIFTIPSIFFCQYVKKYYSTRKTGNFNFEFSCLTGFNLSFSQKKKKENRSQSFLHRRNLITDSIFFFVFFWQKIFIRHQKFAKKHT